MQGTIRIPREAVAPYSHLLLYVEARDFQHNVRTGYSHVQLPGDRSVTVHIDTVKTLPCFGHE
jgi:hypothetical protein